MLNSYQGSRILVIAQDPGQVHLVRVESPPKGFVGKTQHADRMRVPTRVQCSSAWAALRSRAEVVFEDYARVGKRIQRRGVYGFLTVASQMLAEVMTGEEENVWPHFFKPHVHFQSFGSLAWTGIIKPKDLLISNL